MAWQDNVVYMGMLAAFILLPSISDIAHAYADRIRSDTLCAACGVSRNLKS
jgi:hypothetical protein